MKNAQRLLALLMLLLVMPAMGAAATFKPRIAPEVEVGDTLPVFTAERGALGVKASDKWLYQARIQDCSLSLRVHGEEGDPLLFQEDLSRLSWDTLELRLSLCVQDAKEGARLQLDGRAVNMLSYHLIAQIVVADENYTVLARYQTEDIKALREGLGLGDKELLCLSGENGEVTVVSEDGVRRQIAL